MTRSAWYLTFIAALALAATVGCGNDGNSCEGVLCIDASGDDASMGTPDAGPGNDSGTAATTCGSPGRMGGLCTRGTCANSSIECVDPFGGRMLTYREGFNWPQADADDPENPSSFTTKTPVPADDIPVVFAPGGFCTAQCDTSAETDSCGSCAKCTQTLGADPFGIPVGAFIFPAEERQFEFEVLGLCRAHCEFDPEGRGTCPEGYSCDPFSNLCLESCVSDTQCQSVRIITEDGNSGTWRAPGTGVTCNVTTGRCDWEAPANARVGDECDSISDCPADTGRCLRGGTCAQTQCTAEQTCEGDRGVCLPAGANNATICLAGCTTADDCHPGNACVPLETSTGQPHMIGTHRGYCLGICDNLIQCGHEEQCDIPDPTDDEPEPSGTCRSSCDPTAADSCEEGQACVQVKDQSYGFCRSLNDFCFNPGATDCYVDQICNNITGAQLLGRCVDPCTSDEDCTTGAATTCVTDSEHQLAGLCVETCSATSADGGASSDAGVGGCGAGRFCDIATGETSGYCIEVPSAD